MTGLSYYPVDYSGTITLDGADITFDYKQINTRETGNKPLNDENASITKCRQDSCLI